MHPKNCLWLDCVFTVYAFFSSLCFFHFFFLLLSSLEVFRCFILLLCRFGFFVPHFHKIQEQKKALRRYWFDWFLTHSSSTKQRRMANWKTFNSFHWMADGRHIKPRNCMCSVLTNHFQIWKWNSLTRKPNCIIWWSLVSFLPSLSTYDVILTMNRSVPAVHI